MNDPSLVARYFHSCSKLIDATANITAGFFCIVERDGAQVLDFLFERHLPRILVDRNLPELVVGRNARELHVALFRDGAGAGDVGGDAGDALDLLRA